MKSLGRNDPCWCGSGKKYKKCHLGREKDEPIKAWEAARTLKRNFSTHQCTASKTFPNTCEGDIINAHTIPKSSSLIALSRDRHVYGPSYSFPSLDKTEGRIVPELIGVKRASAFTGFCKKHDDEIFAPIEKHSFPTTSEGCFLLAYRAFARECFTKLAQSKTLDLTKQIDRGRTLEEQAFIQHYAQAHEIGINLAKRDMEERQKSFDHMLINKNYDLIRATIFEVDEIPKVMTAGAFHPQYNFSGDILQNLDQSERVPSLITITSFYDGKKGRIVLAWLSDSHACCSKLVESLLIKDKEVQVTLLIQCIFKHIENTYSNPDWWEGIGPLAQNAITDLIHDSASWTSEISSYGMDQVLLNIITPKITSISNINW